MSPTQKAVLMAVAWYASDDGEYWGSVSTVCEHTCLSERAVRKTLHDLANMGYLSAEVRAGTSTKYTLTPAHGAPLSQANPCTSCTPAQDAPLHDMQPPPAQDAPPPLHLVHPTPAPRAPNKQLTTNTKTREQQDTPAALGVRDLVAVGVPEQAAKDFLTTRKAKKAPLTQTALDGIQREAAKAGMTLAAAVTLAAESGWQGFKAKWLNDSPRAGNATNLDHNKAVMAEALRRHEERQRLAGERDA
jgi:hypothetical protein